MKYYIEVLLGGEWKRVSSHTHQADRDAQKQRLLDEGITEENIRFA